MRLKLTAEGASEADLLRGVAAAEEVFTKTGITPVDGANGMMALDLWDINSFASEARPSEELRRWGDIWLDAQSAAVSAALEKLPVGERDGYLELILSDAEREQCVPTQE